MSNTTVREEYTPTMDEIKNWYAGGVDEYWCDTGMLRDEAEAAFDRAIAAHDQAIREQIADDLQVEAENLDLEVPNAHREGMHEGLLRAASIARGEGSE